MGVSPGQEVESEVNTAMMGCEQAGIAKELWASMSRGRGCALHSLGSPCPSLSASGDLWTCAVHTLSDCTWQP